jgi:hypothetical protein
VFFIRHGYAVEDDDEQTASGSYKITVFFFFALFSGRRIIPAHRFFLVFERGFVPDNLQLFVCLEPAI